MTEEEAKIIARIASEADEGCPLCVDYMFDSLAQAFPDVDWKRIAPDDTKEEMEWT